MVAILKFIILLNRGTCIFISLWILQISVDVPGPIRILTNFGGVELDNQEFRHITEILRENSFITILPKSSVSFSKDEEMGCTGHQQESFLLGKACWLPDDEVSGCLI